MMNIHSNSRMAGSSEFIFLSRVLILHLCLAATWTVKWEMGDGRREEMGDGRRRETGGDGRREETGDGRRRETGGDVRREETGDGRRRETGGDGRREETGDGRRRETGGDRLSTRMPNGEMVMLYKRMKGRFNNKGRS